MTQFSREAAGKSREFLKSNQQGTTELQWALGEMAIDNWGALPNPDSAEAEAFVQRTKPERYAYLARTIGPLLNAGFQSTGKDSPYQLPSDITHSPEPWRLARQHFLNAVLKNTKQISPTDEYQNADKICRLIGTLTPGRFIDVETQLWAGTDTAFSTMLSLLQNFPHISQYHQLYFDNKNLPKVAKRSSSLAYELMKRSVGSMMAARSALGKDRTWSVDTILDPEEFKPFYSKGQLHSLRFNDLENIGLPLQEPEEAAQKLKDIDDEGKTIIGCPLSLLYGTYKELWSQTVYAVDRADLWKKISD